MKRIIAIWTFAFLGILQLHGQSVSGWVKDIETMEPLPFATVGVKGTTLGTITNEEGYFEFRVNSIEGELVFNFMGYEPLIKPISSFLDEGRAATLKPTSITLDELVIRPLSPEDYIKRVVKNQINALPQQPYSANAYYREKFKENDGYIAYNEGIFKFHFPTYQDSLANQYQLCLYETAENPQEMQFLKRKTDKKEERKRKKAAKKGEEYEDDAKDLINVSFGGPNEILASQMGEEVDDFLDSTKFRKFRYEFGTPRKYQGRELMVINFRSRGKTDHQKTDGKIYIDTRLDAFAGVEYAGELIIPILIEPILLAFGISFSDLLISKVTRMQYIDGYWYPDYEKMDVTMQAKKRYLFSKNEISQFDIDQVLKVSDLRIGDTIEIPQNLRYDPAKNPEEQVQNTENWEWEDFNRIMEEGSVKL